MPKKTFGAAVAWPIFEQWQISNRSRRTIKPRNAEREKNRENLYPPLKNTPKSEVSTHLKLWPNLPQMERLVSRISGSKNCKSWLKWWFNNRYPLSLKHCPERVSWKTSFLEHLTISLCPLRNFQWTQNHYVYKKWDWYNLYRSMNGWFVW